MVLLHFQMTTIPRKGHDFGLRTDSNQPLSFSHRKFFTEYLVKEAQQTEPVSDTIFMDAGKIWFPIYICTVLEVQWRWKRSPSKVRELETRIRAKTSPRLIYHQTTFEIHLPGFDPLYALFILLAFEFLAHSGLWLKTMLELLMSLHGSIVATLDSVKQIIQSLTNLEMFTKRSLHIFENQGNFKIACQCVEFFNGFIPTTR
jgi:hypothetical protein